jgi:7-cyano-7-deazaguanine synthase
MAGCLSKKGLAVCLVSGGMDSCVTAAIAHELHELAFLHVNYGQRTEKRELEAFEALTEYYQAKKRLVTDITYLKEIGGSALTDFFMPVPEGSQGVFSEIPSTYVPFRNTHIIAIAVSWAEVIGACFVYIGATEVDSSGYPDCRESYFNAYNKLIAEGTRPGTDIKIVTPLIRFTKKMVVEKAIAMNAPMHLTWSCYQNEKTACGRCDSCLLRLKGFREAGATDPIPYEGLRQSQKIRNYV